MREILEHILSGAFVDFGIAIYDDHAELMIVVDD